MIILITLIILMDNYPNYPFVPIVELISDNMEEAASIMSKSAEYALEEERLAARCVRELGLIQGCSQRIDFSNFF